MIKLIVSGRVGSDAELKTVGDTTVCSFSIAHTEKVYGQTPGEKTIWVGCNIWGERAVKLNPFITKGTYIVAEGSGTVNAFMKNGEPVGMINCRITSLEFGGKPTAEPTPHTATPPVGKLISRAIIDLGEDLPF
jgi:single-strand DNA-binding protein